MTLKNTNALGFNSSVTLSASTFTISNNLALTPSNALSFVLGTNAATIAVIGNLAFGGTNNIVAGDGFTNGTYTLMTYTGTLSGNSPTLGATPPGYNYAIDTTTPGQVNLLVSPLTPATPLGLTATPSNLVINLNWSASANASGYNLKRSLTNGGPYSILTTLPATNFSDIAVSPEFTYYYVVSATNSAGESARFPSGQRRPVALVDLHEHQLPVHRQPTRYFLALRPLRLAIANSNQQPDRHELGRRPRSSTLTNQIVVALDTTNSEFFRLVYP